MFKIVLGFAVIICLFEACAQNSLKQSVKHKSDGIFVAGLVFYMGVGYLLHKAYHKIGLGQMNLVWSCMSIIVALSAGYLLYDEPFNRYTLLAVLFALAAIYTAYEASKLHDKK